MTDAHDLAVSAGVRPCGDGQFFGKGWWINHQTVIARGGEWGNKFREKSLTVVLDLVRLTVHQFWGANNFSTESLTDGLVTEADAKQRDATGKMFHAIDADASFVWSARSRGNQDSCRRHLVNLFHRNFVISEHTHVDIAVNFAQTLDKIVREGIVVIDHNDHGGIFAREVNGEIL